jgi:hypothetical protein
MNFEVPCRGFWARTWRAPGGYGRAPMAQSQVGSGPWLMALVIVAAASSPPPGAPPIKSGVADLPGLSHMARPQGGDSIPPPERPPQG